MAHFAQLDESNVVTQVIVVHSNELLDNGVESEAKGIAFCQSLFGANTRWVQTSYNGKIRGVYAGVGYTYNADIDAFAPPKPYPSWVLNENAQWQAPVPMPDDGKMYTWDESAQVWIEVEGVPV
jgi:hypothetical protein